NAQMRLFYIEKERARNRIFTSCNRFCRWCYVIDASNPQLVCIVFVEIETENTNAGFVGFDTRQRFAVIAININGFAVFTNCNTSRCGCLVVQSSCLNRIESTRGFAAFGKNLFFKNFASTVFFAWNIGRNIPIWQIGVNLIPLGVWIVDQLAVNNHFGSKSLIEIDRLKLPVRTICGGCKNRSEEHTSELQS